MITDFDLDYTKPLKFIQLDKRFLVKDLKYVDTIDNHSTLEFKIYKNDNFKNEVSKEVYESSMKIPDNFTDSKNINNLPFIKFGQELFFDDNDFGKGFFVDDIMVEKRYILVRAVDWLQDYQLKQVNTPLAYSDYWAGEVELVSIKLETIMEIILESLHKSYRNLELKSINYYDGIEDERRYLPGDIDDLSNYHNFLGYDSFGNVFKKLQNLFNFEYRTYSHQDRDNPNNTYFTIRIRKKLVGAYTHILKGDTNLINLTKHETSSNVINNVTIYTSKYKEVVKEGNLDTVKPNTRNITVHSITDHDSAKKYRVRSSNVIIETGLVVENPITYEEYLKERNKIYNLNNDLNKLTKEIDGKEDYYKLIALIESVMKVDADVYYLVNVTSFADKALIGDSVRLEYHSKNFRIYSITKSMVNGKLHIDSVTLSETSYWTPTKTLADKFNNITSMIDYNKKKTEDNNRKLDKSVDFYKDLTTLKSDISDSYGSNTNRSLINLPSEVAIRNSFNERLIKDNIKFKPNSLNLYNNSLYYSVGTNLKGVPSPNPNSSKIVMKVNGDEILLESNSITISSSSNLDRFKTVIDGINIIELSKKVDLNSILSSDAHQLAISLERDYKNFKFKIQKELDDFRRLTDKNMTAINNNFKRIYERLNDLDGKGNPLKDHEV